MQGEGEIIAGMDYILNNRKRPEFWMKILVWLRILEMNMIMTVKRGWLRLKCVRAPKPELEADEILESLKWFTES